MEARRGRSSSVTSPERKRAEEALRESELRFRTLAGATFEGVAVTEKGRFTDINEQFCKLSGFDRSELLGMDVSMLVHPDDRDRVLDNIATGRESAVEHRMIRKDGSLITVEAHGKTVRHDGRDRRLTAVRDITEARKAEEAIRSAALFPIQNPEPVLRVHRDGTLLFSNPAAEPVLAEWRTESGKCHPGPGSTGRRGRIERRRPAGSRDPHCRPGFLFRRDAHRGGPLCESLRLGCDRSQTGGAGIEGERGALPGALREHERRVRPP